MVPVLATGAGPAWKRVESKPGRYSVEFPDTPKEHKGYSGGKGTPWYNTYTFHLHKDGVFYKVSATVPTDELPIFLNINALPGEKRGDLLGTAKKRKWKVLLDKESPSTRFKGYAMIVEFTRRKVKHMTRAGWYVVGGIGYEIEVIGPSDIVRGKDVDRFFKSFKMGQ
jgi:hypothetical protein